MKTIDLLKKRVNETRDKQMRAEVERDQLKKQEAAYYEEASDIIGEKVTTLEQIGKHRDEKTAAIVAEVKQLAQELLAINALTESDVQQLKEEGYL